MTPWPAWEAITVPSPCSATTSGAAGSRADPAVLGQTLRIAGIPVTVVGVVRSGFSGIEIADSVDVWVPVALQPKLSLGQSSLDQPGDNWLRAIARLNPDVSREQARDASNAVFSQLPNAQGQEILLDDAAYGPLDVARACVVFTRFPDGRRGPGPAHRLRERREPLPGQGEPPPARDDIACRARSESRPPDSTTADRESAPIVGGRRRSVS